jgi:hypothetical protein
MEEDFLPPLYCFPLKSVLRQHLVRLIDASFIFIVVRNLCSIVVWCCLQGTSVSDVTVGSTQNVNALDVFPVCSREMMSLADSLNW